MKKNILFVALLLLVAIGCGDSKEKKVETLLVSNQQATDSLSQAIQSEIGKRDQLATEIDELDTYAKSLGILYVGEKNPDKKADYTTKLKDIAGTLKAQKQTISNLQKKVASLQEKLDRVTAENEKLKTALASVQTENAGLKLRVDSLTVLAARLKSQLAETKTIAEDRDTRLRTGYYVIGNTGFLREKGVLERRGMGNAYNPRFNLKSTDFVTKVDVAQQTEIEINAAKGDVVIWSPHTSDSYELVENPSDRNKSILKIKDIEGFWQTAKVLAIGTDG